MTNTHRKTTNRTTAKIAAVGAFGIGAAIAFPGLAAAQDATTPEGPTASLENLAGEEGSLSDLTGEDGSLEGALGTDLALDAGSLALNVNLDAETPNPGSVELGSLGVVHGALGGREEYVDGGTGAHLLDKVARRLKLRVGKRGAGLVGIELLNLGQGLLERVGSKDLQLDSLLGRNLGGAGIGASRPRRLAAGTAGKAKAGSGDSGK